MIEQPLVLALDLVYYSPLDLFMKVKGLIVSEAPGLVYVIIIVFFQT